MSGAKPVSPRRPLWAELIQPVFEVDALCCPKCGGRLRVLSAITDPVVAARILDCLALPSRAPPLAISGHRVGRSDFDEDWVGGISEFDFDHSQPSNESESGARKEVRWFSSRHRSSGLTNHDSRMLSKSTSIERVSKKLPRFRYGSTYAQRSSPSPCRASNHPRRGASATY